MYIYVFGHSIKVFKKPTALKGLELNKPLHFRSNVLEKIWRLIMTIDDNIRDDKLQHKREATEIFALTSCKIDKYECLTSKEILPSNQI